MLIIETPIFTHRIYQFISDNEYRLLQRQLIAKPDFGKVIVGSGGLRKIRWSIGERGKRGGIRVIYYWSPARDTVLMLFVYSKNEQDNLTSAQLRKLKSVVDEEYR